VNAPIALISIVALFPFSIACPLAQAQQSSLMLTLPINSADRSLSTVNTELSPAPDHDNSVRKVADADENSHTAVPSIQIEPHASSPVNGAIRRPFYLWLTLSLAGQAAMLADVKTTLDMKHSNPITFYESDPFARPFVNLPPPAYVATSVGLSSAVSLAGWKLSGSENRWLRRHWWLPQLAQIALNAKCAFHNARK